MTHVSPILAAADVNPQHRPRRDLGPPASRASSPAPASAFANKQKVLRADRWSNVHSDRMAFPYTASCIGTKPRPGDQVWTRSKTTTASAEKRSDCKKKTLLYSFYPKRLVSASSPHVHTAHCGSATNQHPPCNCARSLAELNSSWSPTRAH